MSVNPSNTFGAANLGDSSKGMLIIERMLLRIPSKNRFFEIIYVLIDFDDKLLWSKSMCCMK